MKDREKRYGLHRVSFFLEKTMEEICQAADGGCAQPDASNTHNPLCSASEGDAQKAGDFSEEL